MRDEKEREGVMLDLFFFLVWAEGSGSGAGGCAVVECDEVEQGWWHGMGWDRIL